MILEEFLGPEVLSGDGVLVIGKLSDGYVPDASRVLHSVLPRVFFGVILWWL